MVDPGERAGRFKFLIRDRDSKFTSAFGDVFSGDSTRVITTPVRSPRRTHTRNGSRERFAASAWITC
jgi:putative transposase